MDRQATDCVRAKGSNVHILVDGLRVPRDVVQADAFDEENLASILPAPDVAVVSGWYEIDRWGIFTVSLAEQS